MSFSWGGKFLCLCKLRSLATDRPGDFVTYANANLVIDLLSSPGHGGLIHSNRVDVVRLVAELLRLLSAAAAADPAVGAPAARSVHNVARSSLWPFLNAHGVQLPVAVAISNLYSAHPEVLPHPDKWPEFQVLVIKLLAGFRMPPSSEDTFLAAVNQVSKMLPLLWGRTADSDGIQRCLEAFYAIITAEEADASNRPSCALLYVVDKIPPPFLKRATLMILEDSGVAANEAKTVAGLQTVVQWIAEVPSPGMVGPWVVEMLKGLREAGRNSILIEIAHACSRQLCAALADRAPVVAVAAEPVFFFLLLGFQHSELVFHSIVTDLPDVFRRLGERARASPSGSGEHARDARLILRLGEAASFFMGRFPGYPELYQPVEEALTALNVENVTEDRTSGKTN